VRLTVVSVEGLRPSTSNGGLLGSLQAAFTSSSDMHYYAVLLWNGCAVGRTHSVASSSDTSNSHSSNSRSGSGSGREVQWNRTFDIAAPLQQYTTTNITAVKVTLLVYRDTAANNSSSNKHITAVLLGEAAVQGTADAFAVCNGASGRVLELPLLHTTAASTDTAAKAVATTDVTAVCGRATLYLHRAATETDSSSGANSSAAHECTDAVAAREAVAAVKSLDQQTATISDGSNSSSSSSSEMVLHVSGVTWPGQLPAQQCCVTIKLNGRTLHRLPVPLHNRKSSTITSYSGAHASTDSDSSVRVHAATGDELLLEAWCTAAKDSDATASSKATDSTNFTDVCLGESRILLTANALKALLQGGSIRRRLRPKQAALLLQQTTVLPLLHSSSISSSSSDSCGYVCFTLQPVAVPFDYSIALQRSYNERGLQAVVTLQAAVLHTFVKADSYNDSLEQVLVKIEFKGKEVWRSGATIAQGRVTFDGDNVAHNVAPAQFVLPLEEVSYIDHCTDC
jgi:hypothetical protein